MLENTKWDNLCISIATDKVSLVDITPLFLYSALFMVMK